MLGIDLGERAKRTLYGVRWTFGLVPFGRLSELRGRFGLALDAFRAAGEKPTTEQLLELTTVYAEIVAWGVTGWSSPNPVRETVRLDYAGRTYEVLSPDVLDILLHVEAGALVADLAIAVLETNRLSPDVLLGFPSASPT